MKTPDEITPNYAPIYAAALYPDLAAFFQSHGYALAVHGSLARDFDLIAVPWIQHPTPHDVVIQALAKTFAIKQLGTPVHRDVGRYAYALAFDSFGEWSLDLSFFPFVIDTESSKLCQ